MKTNKNEPEYVNVSRIAIGCGFLDDVLISPALNKILKDSRDYYTSLQNVLFLARKMQGITNNTGYFVAYISTNKDKIKIKHKLYLVPVVNRTIRIYVILPKVSI